MDNEIARQLGNGLSALSASLLEHQRASARDRGMMLQKLDDLREDFTTQFNTLAKDIVDVCDRGGQQHRGFAQRLDAIERRLEVEAANRQGQDHIKKAFAGATTWTLDHGWKLALVLYVVWTQAAPILATAAGIQN